jgi:hypothetical protein
MNPDPNAKRHVWSKQTQAEIQREPLLEWLTYLYPRCNHPDARIAFFAMKDRYAPQDEPSWAFFGYDLIYQTELELQQGLDSIRLEKRPVPKNVTVDSYVAYKRDGNRGREMESFPEDKDIQGYLLTFVALYLACKGWRTTDGDNDELELVKGNRTIQIKWQSQGQ